MMLDADRLKERMSALDYSQARLARQVGVSQQTIAKLSTGESAGSRFLHKIARALQTTPAYLEGETDDPDCDAPEYNLTAEEEEWVALMRQLAPKDRAAVIHLTRTIATSAVSPMLNAKMPDWKPADG